MSNHDVCECGANDVKYYGSRCANNPDCHYKQLLRLKAEYKKFSEYLPIAARLAKRFKTFEEVKGIEYDGILSEFLAENEKLKKTLKEIEKIAKRICVVVCNGYECKELVYRSCINREIIEKIREVENERQI